MKWGKYSFGSLQIDGEEYTKDVILDRGVIRKRKKKASRRFREQFGHTPLSLNLTFANLPGLMATIFLLWEEVKM